MSSYPTQPHERMKRRWALRPCSTIAYTPFLSLPHDTFLNPHMSQQAKPSRPCTVIAYTPSFSIWEPHDPFLNSHRCWSGPTGRWQTYFGGVWWQRCMKRATCGLPTTRCPASTPTTSWRLRSTSAPGEGVFWRRCDWENHKSQTLQ